MIRYEVHHYLRELKMNTINLKRWTSLYMIWIACSYGVLANAQTKEQPTEKRELNLYSARHYQTDEALYSDFTKKTGIKINRIEATDQVIAERLKSEGNKSPADVILMVDAAKLWKGQNDGIFKPIHSKFLEERVPENLRAKSTTEGITWFGLSTRARIIVYNKSKIKPTDVDSYEKLANSMNKGRVCTRSGVHPYMLSLVSAMIELKGETTTEQWARDMVSNMARTPQGGDTDQIKAVAAGECGVALTNSYYLARLLGSNKLEDQELIKKIGFLMPNQQTTGTHINIAGGGVAKNAPHPNEAKEFLEYLVSDSAQKYFANGNNEWAIVKSVDIENAALKQLGSFKTESISVESLGKNQHIAQKILDRAGYK